MQHLKQDLVYAWRTLRRTPGFTVVAVLALALGIGANTAIFSLINAVLLRPLPFPDADRLVSVSESGATGNGNDVAPPNFLDWRSAQRSFTDLAAFTPVSLNLTGVEAPENLEGLRVTASLFSVLGVEPSLGRTFGETSDIAGGERVVVLSDELWRSRFQADPGIIGRVLTLDEEPHTVIGVMPAGFRFPIAGEALLWVPMAFTAGDLSGRGAHYLGAAGRLAPGVSLARAQADMDLIARRLQREYPVTNEDAGISLVPLKDSVVGPTRTTFLLLWGAVGFVLLIATANVASMLLARAAGREREIAIRLALGAGAGRLIPQLLTESLMLSGLGGLAGLGLGVLGIRILEVLNPGGIARFGEAGIDVRVLGFTLLISFGTGLLFGLVPALSLTRADVQQALRAGGRGMIGPRGRWYRASLVVSEIALAVMLLVGAGLLIGSFRNLQRTDPGFDPDHLLTLRIDLPRGPYEALDRRADFFQRVLPRIEAVPGVESAGAISFLPMNFPGGSVGIAVEGAPPADEGEFQGAVYRAVSADYFAAMDIPLTSGRPFGSSDMAGAPGVVIVNRAMADRWWPGRSPIGRRLKVGRPESNVPWLTVVGVAGDVRQFELRRESRPEIYIPVTQPHPLWTAPRAIVVRTASEPLAVAPAVRAAIWSVNPDLPVSDVRPMTDVVGATVAELRFYTVLLSLLGATALVLAAVGIYGVISYGVNERAREIGVRMALGAGRPDILGMVLRQGMLLALAGLGLGLAGALGLSRFLGALLYDLAPADPGTLIQGGVVILTAALLACLVPAHRASRIDPVESLRRE